MPSSLDNYDIEILKHLEEDGKKPFSQIAEELDISNTMVHQRVARLKKEGVLSHHSIIIDERKLGYEWGAFTGIILNDNSDTDNVIAKLQEIPEVTECYHISGSFSLFIRIVARNSEHMRSLLYSRIEEIKGVMRTESMVDFGCAFKRNPPFGDNA